MPASWPATLPIARRGQDYQPGPAMIRTAGDGPAAMARRRFHRVPTMCFVSWTMTTEQLSIFDAFYFGPLKAGADWISDLTLQNGDGITANNVGRFIEGTLRRQKLPGNFWKITATIETDGVFTSGGIIVPPTVPTISKTVLDPIILPPPPTPSPQYLTDGEFHGYSCWRRINDDYTGPIVQLAQVNTADTVTWGPSQDFYPNAQGILDINEVRLFAGGNNLLIRVLYDQVSPGATFVANYFTEGGATGYSQDEGAPFWDASKNGSNGDFVKRYQNIADAAPMFVAGFPGRDGLLVEGESYATASAPYPWGKSTGLNTMDHDGGGSQDNLFTSFATPRGSVFLSMYQGRSAPQNFTQGTTRKEMQAVDSDTSANMGSYSTGELQAQSGKLGTAAQLDAGVPGGVPVVFAKTVNVLPNAPFGGRNSISFIRADGTAVSRSNMTSRHSNIQNGGQRFRNGWPALQSEAWVIADEPGDYGHNITESALIALAQEMHDAHLNWGGG